ncbi:MAG: hypothetical protein RJB39_11 [Candidatus Parcubacteria bacterium]|jgi:cysteine desulfurase
MFSRIFGQKIYLDYAAITPVDLRVVKIMNKILKSHWHNPSSLYDAGVQASKYLEKSRKDVSAILSGVSANSVHSDEIIFTGGGTESNNMAIQGVLKAWKGVGLPHIVTTAIEHPSVKKLVENLIKESKITASFVGVDADGLVDLKELKEILQTHKNIALVSVMLVNNELGTIQPISEIASLIRKYRKEQGGVYPIFHTDACQAPNYIDMQIDKMGVDLLTLDGGKIYGPRGTGCLYIKRNTPIHKIFFGGAQESDLRPGTENLPGIVGFAAALRLVHADKEKENNRLRSFQEYIKKNLPESVSINGTMDPDKRISNNVNICLPGLDAEFLLFKFDVAGIELSTGTTCQNKQEDSRSYVVDALGNECGGSSLRISMGRGTTKRHVETFIKVLGKIIKK